MNFEKVRLLERIYRVHFKDRRVSQASNKKQAYPEDEGNAMVRNVGEPLPDQTVHIPYDSTFHSCDSKR
jgi:hypothetical protein